MTWRVSSRADWRRGLDDPRWHLAQRIAVSRSIGRSPLLSEFLLYICDRYLRDQTSELTEQRIGVQVFGRSEGYNSNDDNIVRNYARTLRKRVEEYFATEGRHEDLKLEIPRGAYIPVFYSRPSDKPPALAEIHPTPDVVAPVLEIAPPHKDRSPLPIEEPSPEEQLPSTEDSLPVVVHRPLPVISPLATFCIVLLAAITVYLAVRGFSHAWRGTAAAASQSPRGSLWSQLFQKERDTFIVPADSGLVIMQGLTQRPVSLGEYVSGSYRAEATSYTGLSSTEVEELGTRRYTSIVDLNLVFHLSQLKQVIPQRIVVCYARDLRMDDLRSGNAILLGSVDSNPWVGLFEQQLNFRFSFSPKSDTAPIIVNQRPLAGEKSVYATQQTGSWHSTFGRIAYLPNLDGTGHVLLIGGLNMAGTQAAGDFVLNAALMRPVLDHARAPNGSIRPFEILIETGNVAANASSPHIVSERIAPL